MRSQLALLTILCLLLGGCESPDYLDDPFVTASGKQYRTVGLARSIKSLQQPKSWVSPWAEGTTALRAWDNRVFAIDGGASTEKAWKDMRDAGLIVLGQKGPNSEYAGLQVALLEIEPRAIGAILPLIPFAPKRSWADPPGQVDLVLPYSENLDLLASGLLIWTSSNVNSDFTSIHFDEPVPLRDLISNLSAYLPKKIAQTDLPKE